MKLAAAGLAVGCCLLAACTSVTVVAPPATVTTQPAIGVVASCEADAKSVETAFEAYRVQMGYYSSSLDALASMATAPSGQTVGPWLRQLPSTADYTILADQSGNVYVYGPNMAQPSSFSDAHLYSGSGSDPCLTYAR